MSSEEMQDYIEMSGVHASVGVSSMEADVTLEGGTDEREEGESEKEEEEESEEEEEEEEGDREGMEGEGEGEGDEGPVVRAGLDSEEQTVEGGRRNDSDNSEG